MTVKRLEREGDDLMAVTKKVTKEWVQANLLPGVTVSIMEATKVPKYAGAIEPELLKNMIVVIATGPEMTKGRFRIWHLMNKSLAEDTDLDCKKYILDKWAREYLREVNE